MQNRQNFLSISRRDFIKKTAITASALSLASVPKVAMAKNAISDQLCVFSKHLQWLDYDAMAEIIAEIGFNGVDLAVRPRGHVLPENVERDLPKAVKAVEKAGLKVLMMTTGINDADDQYTEKVLKTASDLGIKYYRMAYLKYDMDKGVAASFEGLKKQVEKLASMNEKYGMHGAYQNHSGNRVGGPVWDIWYLIKDLDPRWIGCQYDIRHATVEGAFSWPLGMDLLKNHIKISAIKDFVWDQSDGKLKIKNVPMGEGVVDYDQYLTLVKKYNAFGPTSLHFEYQIHENEKELPIDKRKALTLNVMKKDLDYFKSLLKKHDL